MLVHGLIDENVHFRHTARLINALIAARKPYDLLLFPDERHSPRKLQVLFGTPCVVSCCATLCCLVCLVFPCPVSRLALPCFVSCLVES